MNNTQKVLSFSVTIDSLARKAALEGRLEALTLYIKEGAIDWQGMARNAASGGYLDVLQYIITERADENDWNDMARSAVFSGHLHILRYLIFVNTNNNDWLTIAALAASKHSSSGVSSTTNDWSSLVQLALINKNKNKDPAYRESHVWNSIIALAETDCTIDPRSFLMDKGYRNWNDLINSSNFDNFQDFQKLLNSSISSWNSVVVLGTGRIEIILYLLSSETCDWDSLAIGSILAYHAESIRILINKYISDLVEVLEFSKSLSANIKDLRTLPELKSDGWSSLFTNQAFDGSNLDVVRYLLRRDL